MLRSMRRVFGCLTLLGVIAGPVQADPAKVVAKPYAPAADGARVIYRNVALIDGASDVLRAEMAVVTDGPTISAVLNDRDLTAEMLSGAQVVDIRGSYMLPGLIDDHQHLATPPDQRAARAQMRRDIYGGITAARIMADDLRAIAELNREARMGEIEGPDLYFAALMAGKGFFDDPRTRAAAQDFAPGTAPWMQAITDETNLATAVSIARGTGATGIKLYADLSSAQLKGITEEAHRQGIPVWAHGMVFPTAPSEVIAASPDVISHTCYLAYQLSDPRPQSYQNRFPVDYPKFENGDHPEMSRLFAEMKSRDIVLDPTLWVYAATDKRAAENPGGKPYHCTLALAARLTNQAHRAGVAIAAGTDGFTPWNAPHSALHEELELLVSRAGLSPMAAIKSATSVGARTIGQEKHMGTIAPGKLANMVVVRKDPLRSISNLRDVAFTVKHGRRYDRADYRPITRDEVGEE